MLNETENVETAGQIPIESISSSLSEPAPVIKAGGSRQTKGTVSGPTIATMSSVNKRL